MNKRKFLTAFSFQAHTKIFIKRNVGREMFQGRVLVLRPIPDETSTQRFGRVLLYR